uniref:AB hydrolase-1 domain-containing protein n=1 Tax=Ditylenchus dipsaci TaxID=166011 RepID=A0A915DMP9_9BILA
MPSLMENIVRTLLVSFFTVLWSTVTLIKLLWEWFNYKDTKAGPWQHRFLQLSKIRMHYVEAGDPSRPLMVMVHGFPEFWYSYRFQLRHFQKDYHVVALDLRGYGQTEKPVGLANYDTDVLAGDVVEAIEQLGGKAILIGHDWGAAVCWTVAIKRPDVIADRLVILNLPHPKSLSKMMKTSGSQVLKSWYMFMIQCPWLPELRIKVNDFLFLDQMLRGPFFGLKHSENFTDEDMEAWKYTFGMSGNTLTAPLDYYRQNMRSAPSKKYPKELVQPKTLIIWGEQDAALEVEGAVQSVPLCRDAKLVRIAKASHWVQQDAPEQVNSLIEQFVK